MQANSGADLNALVDELDRRAAEQHAPVAGGVTLATLHAAKGLEWDAVFVCGLRRGHPADRLRRDARRGRGGAPAALRRHDPRPGAPVAVLGAGPQRRWPPVTQAAAGSSTGCARATPSSACPAPAGGRKKTRGALTCRECGKALSTGAEKKTGRCADCPASYDEELFERLRAWRIERATDDKVPAFVVFTDATLQLIAEHLPGTEQALLKINGIGRSKLDKYGDAVLAVLAGEVPERAPEDELEATSEGLRRRASRSSSTASRESSRNSH